MLKSIDSINNLPNGKEPKSKLKAIYNISKAKWIMKYGTTRFQHHHMKYVLVWTWEVFTVSAVNIIRYSFDKTHLLPIVHQTVITNTQACVASIQIISKGINYISEDTLVTIKLLWTNTINPMVILQENGSTRQPSKNNILWAVSYDTVQKRTVLHLQNIKR